MRLGKPLPADDLDRIGRECAELWPQLGGARLLVTGATGFFGRWLMESLLAADRRLGLAVRIVALSRDPGAFLALAPHLAVPSIEWRTGSVATLGPGDFSAEKFDIVVHLATEADLQATRADPASALSVITEGTRRVLELAGRTGAKRLLFTSSGAVYGPQPQSLDRMPEDYVGAPDPRDTASPYALPGVAKRQAELLCAEAARLHGLGAVIARCFTFAGPALPLDGKFAFGNFLRDALAGRQITIKGDGTNVRSYLYPADLAVWLWSLLLRGTPGRAYNVGSEKAFRLLEVAEAIDAVFGGRGVVVMGQATAGAAPERYVPATGRARRELSLREQFGLAEIIRRTAAWHGAELKH